MRLIYGFIVVLVSFSCMVYELTLAQTSSLLLGNALVNYSVTICIYLAALGVGSLLFTRFESSGAGRVFLNTEIVLSYLGPLAPIIAMIAELMLRQVFPPGSIGYFISLQALVYTLVAVVGILSGLELPIMIHLGERHFRMGSGAVLGLDYAGTLVAVAAFPVLGLATLGLFGTSAMAGVGSWVGAAATIWFLRREQNTRVHTALLLPSLVLIVCMVLFKGRLQDFMSHAVFLAGDR